MVRFGDDLTGLAAFNAALDKLVEELAQRRAEELRGATEAARQASDLYLAEAKLRAQVTELLQKFTSTEFESAVTALYEAVEYAAHVHVSNNPTLSARLREAAAALRKFVDPIPF